MESGTGSRCAVLAERHHGLSEGMRGLLQPLFAAIVMVADEASLLEALARLRPEVVVLDLGLAPSNGIRLLARLHADFPATRIVVIASDEGSAVRRAAITAGAAALVRKRDLVPDLFLAVEAALARTR
jgi:DNA-binding NarL/FixJ family response regulator